MKNPILGIIGGGQLGSLLSVAANKIGIKTVILSDDENAPAKNFTEKFIYGKYDNKSITQEFIDSVDLVTYEFENIPFNILQSINNEKTVATVNQLIKNDIPIIPRIIKDQVCLDLRSVFQNQDDIIVQALNNS